MQIAAERKALITGGASGIGLEVARQLAKAGASVALLDVNAQQLDVAVQEIGDAALALPADVSSPREVQDAVARAVKSFGGLDTLVLCAGIIHVKPLADVTEQDWDRTLGVNLKGAFLCSQAAAPALAASGRGRIVTISSDAGRRGTPALHAYCASKFGLVGLTESLAGELAPAVTANCICPIGIPSTSMGQQMLAWKVDHTGRAPDEVLTNVASGVPMGRNATEADIAHAVMFFVSETAGFITGVTIDVDGGAKLLMLPGAEAGSAP